MPDARLPPLAYSIVCSTLLALACRVSDAAPTKPVAPAKTKRQVFDPLAIVATLPTQCSGVDMMGSFMVSCDDAPPMTTVQITEFNPAIGPHGQSPDAAFAIIKRLYGAMGPVTEVARSGAPKGEWMVQAKVAPAGGMTYIVFHANRVLAGRALYCIGTATEASTLTRLLDICKQVKAK
jgi:hypothetical protein